MGRAGGAAGAAWWVWEGCAGVEVVLRQPRFEKEKTE